MPYHVSCPQCRAVLVLNEEQVGAAVRCGNCNALWDVPLEALGGAVAREPLRARPRRLEPQPGALERQHNDSILPILLIAGGVTLAAVLIVGGLVVFGFLFAMIGSRGRSGGPAAQGPPGQGPGGQQPNDPPARPAPRPLPGEPFAYLRQCARDGRLTDLGVKGRTTNRTFREVPEEGAVLVGFHVGLHKFIDNDIISGLQAIYLTRDGEKTGAWFGKPAAAGRQATVRARAGYAVNGVDLRSGLLLDALSLDTARLKLDHGWLEQGDRIASEWVGGPGGGLASVRGSGAVIVGIYGHLEDDGMTCSVGLLAAVLP